MKYIGARSNDKTLPACLRPEERRDMSPRDVSDVDVVPAKRKVLELQYMPSDR